jgi:hypothetical protein
MAIMPSEYIQIIAAGIYAVALFYTVVTFRRTKRSDQITQINIIMADLRNLDLEIEKISSSCLAILKYHCFIYMIIAC